MSSRPYQSRLITCEVCGRRRRAVQKDRDICQVCLRKEPSTCCRRCGLKKHRVAEETGLCSRCTHIAARPEAICARCLRTRTIYNQEKQLCQTCHQSELRHVRNKTKQTKVKCSVCGEMRYSQLLGRAICRACWTAERNGGGVCSACNKLKVIWIKSEHLCKSCYADHMAPNSLQKFVAEFTTPYPYNKVLFDLLVTTINWKSVNRKTLQQFCSFGHFLQQQQLRAPLTWETIEEALPVLGLTNRTVPQLIRSCLLGLGHLLAARGELESRDAYIERRYALSPLNRAPEYMQELLRHYVDWLRERRTTLSNVQSHLKILAPFWSWCQQRGIRSPEEVQASLVNDYLMTLYWQWRCSLCQDTMELDSGDRGIPRTCDRCHAIGSLTKERRYAQNTVRKCRAKLFVFFDWLKINRMVVANPVQRKISAPSPTIQHYPFEVIRQLCSYITASDADPVEALVLYLIIFHALSVWELQHVEIPTILTLHKNMRQPGLAEAYYVIVPKPTPSLGDRSPGRPDSRLDFPASAGSWLRPLLERYERHRQQLVSNQRNRYLFITSRTAHRNVPVAHTFIQKKVRDASTRLLSAVCNPNMLRKTAGVLFADRAGAGVLRWMGWDDKQAFKYAWVPREAIQPQQPNDSQDAHSRPSADPATFPSPREKTYKNGPI